MRINRSALAYAASFLGSVVGPIVLYRASHGLPLWALGACVLTFGRALGLAIGWLVGRVAVLPVAAAAFCALALLWMPVLFASLGGAFVAFPILVVYAALVAVGANLERRLYRGESSALKTTCVA